MTWQIYEIFLLANILTEKYYRNNNKMIVFYCYRTENLTKTQYQQHFY